MVILKVLLSAEVQAMADERGNKDKKLNQQLALSEELKKDICQFEEVIENQREKIVRICLPMFFSCALGTVKDGNLTISSENGTLD